MEYTGTIPVSPDGSSYKVWLLLPEEVMSHWDLLLPLLEKGYDSLEVLPEDLLEMALRNSVQLWYVSKDGVPILAMATTFVHYPRRKLLHVMALGGSGLLGGGNYFWPKVQDFMVRNDCAVITAYCGHAMSAMLQRFFGFKKRYDVVEKTITGALQ